MNSQGAETAASPAARPWKRPGTTAALAFILLSAALAVAPQVIRGNSCGHDFDFHLVSWLDALHSWRQGIFYPRWAPSPNFNAGEPRFIFYPPLTWMLGAALGAVLPWNIVPSVLVFLLLAGTGLATRALARQVLSSGPSTLAGCVAIFSGYTLFTVYERSAYAELAGGIWIPLLLLPMLCDFAPKATSPTRRTVLGPAILLALIVAAAWLSNAPVGVMTSYLLAALALVTAVLSRTWMPLLRAAAGEALGLALAAFYLIPAACEQRWADIRQAIDDPGLAIRNSFLFGHPAGPQLALHDIELARASWVAVAMIVVTLGCLALSWRRHTLPGSRRWWLPLALIPIAILLLLLPISLPLWNVLPKLRFLQFPWRWLVALEAPLGIFVASAVWVSGRTRRNALAILAAFACLFVGLAVFAGRVFFQVCDQYDAVPGMLQDYGDGGGYGAVDEYAPPGADNSMVPEDLPGACLVSNPEIVLGKITPADPQPDWSPAQKTCDAAFQFAPAPGQPVEYHKRIHGAAPHAGFLILHLRRYPAWRIRLNGSPVKDMPERDDGLMAVPVAAGPVDLSVDWTTTPDVRWGSDLSIAALALVTALATFALRRRRSQLE